MLSWPRGLAARSTVRAEAIASGTDFPEPGNGEDHREYVVPVRWERTRARSDAYWVKGMFANQNSACKLRNRFTLEQLASAFELEG